MNATSAVHLRPATEKDNSILHPVFIFANEMNRWFGYTLVLKDTLLVENLHLLSSIQ